MRSVTGIEDAQMVNGHGYYSGADTARIARVPMHTVYTWRQQGIVAPSVKWVDETGREELGYTFNSVVYIRLLRMLREASIPLEKAVLAVSSHLVDRFGPPGPAWGDVRIFADGHNVYVYSKDEWETTVAPSGQKLAEQLFGQEFLRLRERADALLIPRKYQPFVEINPRVRNGLPVILDTSILTQMIHALRHQGQEYAEIQKDYPLLTLPQVKGADAFETFLDAEALVA